MHHEIRPSLGNSIYYDDGEIDGVIINKNGVRRSVPIDLFYQDVPGNNYTMECRDASSCYRIIRAEKKGKLIEIELGDSTLKHHR